MNRGLIITLSILGAVAVIIGAIFFSFIGAGNSANRYEVGIDARYDAMKTKMSEYSVGILEIVQVPTMYQEDYVNTVTEIMTARYGADGNNSAFTAIVEAYPGNFDSTLYTRVQDYVAAGRANFAAEQKVLIDQVMVYKTELGTIPTGFMMGVMGYPRINFADYAIVTDARTDVIFETKRAEPIKLR